MNTEMLKWLLRMLLKGRLSLGCGAIKGIERTTKQKSPMGNRPLAPIEWFCTRN